MENGSATAGVPDGPALQPVVELDVARTLDADHAQLGERDVVRPQTADVAVGSDA